MGRRHLEAYLKNPEVIVEACADSNAEALKFLKTRKVDCKRFADWHQMLKDQQFDLLSVVTNAPSHAEITLAAADSEDSRVICEKPMATSIKDGKRMLIGAQENGTHFGHQLFTKMVQGLPTVEGDNRKRYCGHSVSGLRRLRRWPVGL